jgi:hypothetical protein
MIIVYGIQRSDVKNCFCEEPNGNAMNSAWEKQKFRAYRETTEDFRSKVDISGTAGHERPV